MENEKSNNKLRNSIWIIFGIILMGVFVMAATTISNTQIDLGGGIAVNIINLSAPGLQNLTITSKTTFVENVTLIEVLFLSNNYELGPGPAKVLRRNSANGAVFGIANDVPAANTFSGVGYIWLTNSSNYTIDLHSELDLNNANEVIHHLRGDLIAERWRLASGLFVFEDGLDSSILTINTTNREVTFADLAGDDVAFVCVRSDGTVYRSATACV